MFKCVTTQLYDDDNLWFGP